MKPATRSLTPEALRADIPLLAQESPPCYLDSATANLVPRFVLEAFTGYYESIAVTPARANHELGQKASEALQRARQSVARLIGADPTEVIFVASATAAINGIATMLEVGREPGEVVVNEGEHYANLLPWTRGGVKQAIVRVGGDGEPSLDDYAPHLASARIASLGHVSHLTGTIRPVRAFTEACRKAGCFSLIDASQSVGRMPIDVRELGCDFLVFSAQTLLAPAGIGVMFVRREVLDDLPPAQLGAGSAHRVDAGGTFFTPSNLPGRFEAGSINIGGAVALGTAANALRRHGMAKVLERERQLRAKLLAALSAIPAVRVLGDARADGVGIVSFTAGSDASLDHIGVVLSDRHRVMIRTGNLAGTPALMRLGTSEAARVSTGLYTDEADLDRFGDALGSTLRSLGALQP